MAPAKIVQCKANYIPYYNEEITNQIQNSNQMLTLAINSHSSENWREYRSKRIQLNRDIKILRTQYIKNKMDENHKNWKFLQKFNNCNKNHPPARLNINGTIVTSPKEIANTSNNFLFQK